MPIAPMNCRCAVCISRDNALLEQLLNESPGVESPGVESPGVESPGVESPGVESPGVETPRVESPAVESPETVSCCVCDSEVARDDAITLANDEPACEDCAQYCDRCERYFEEIAEVRVLRRNTEHWCEDCREQRAFTCGDCSDNFHYDMQSGCNTSDEPVCESCAESYYTCESCRSTIHADDARHDDGASFCESCYGESDVIHCYSYKPCAVFHPSRSECEKYRAYGIELEVETTGYRSADAKRVQDILGDFVYLKHDGSLHDGFEIVSHPATIAYHREAWRDFFERRPRTLRSHSTTTCGLHIHASRKGMTSLQIAKIVCFVNSPANRELVELIARRGENGYCKKYAKKLSSAHLDPDGTRYQAVNLEPNRTIEFRLFKGTLSYVQFTQALEFVDAIIDYCAPASRSIADSLRGDSFKSYVAKNKKQWPALARLLGNDSVTTTTQETEND